VAVEREALEAVRETCETILARRDFELVAVSVGQERRQRVLRVTVDRAEGGLTVDEIASVSDEISRALDEQDPIQGSYTLEVSTPGIERPLTRPEDFGRFAGRQIKVRCFEPIEGRRNFQGLLRSAGAESFVLEMPDGELVEIPYVSVARANLVVDWDEELRRVGGER
jgi:ribosome maturation factor RimP